MDARKGNPMNYVSLLFPALLVFFLSPTAQAGSATWNLNPIDNSWDTVDNWTPATVPNGSSDVATFGGSNQRTISFQQNITLDSIVFTSEARPFLFVHDQYFPSTFVLAMTGGGIVNNSANIQNFIVQAGIFDRVSVLQFFNSASAGGLVNYVVEGGTFHDGTGSIVEFINASSAGQASFTIQGGAAADAAGAQVFFVDDSTASAGTFIVNGDGGSGSSAGLLEFSYNASASNALLIANSSSGDRPGGAILFAADSDGGTATVQVYGTAQLDISLRSVPGVTIGSLAGDGLVFLGSNQLAPGSNSSDTTFSGVIQDGGSNGGTGGSLNKIGVRSLTLSGGSLYTGGTTVSDGTLIVNNSIDSATGTGPVQVDAGTLGGSGIIAGAVTVGTGGGSGAFLAPAHGTNKQVTLTIQSALTSNSDATYTYTFKAKSNKSKTDKVVASGVTINSGATFNLSGTAQGTLTQGTVLTVIKNTAATPIAGTFSNLPEGAIVNVNGNNLQASYEGGNGNDLTLTVVP
jgi:autotransporter-associated beta strand protein